MIYFITLMKAMLILGTMLASYQHFPALKILLGFSCIFYTNNLAILTTEKNCHKCCHNFDQWERRSIVCHSEFALFPWVSLQHEKIKTLLSSVIEGKHFLEEQEIMKRRLRIVKHKIIFWNYASCVYTSRVRNSIIIFYTFLLQYDWHIVL